MKTGVVAAMSAAVIGIPLVVAASVPASADGHVPPPPIAVQLLTPRSSFADDVSIKFKIKHDGHGTRVVDLSDPSRVAVARITVQPGARFPWHKHPGPVVVNVVEGQLTYVDGADCSERVYPAGTAFADSGGDIHSAYGSSTAETILIAMFLAAPETGPLTITEGVQAPTNCI